MILEGTLKMYNGEYYSESVCMHVCVRACVCMGKLQSRPRLSARP